MVHASNTCGDAYDSVSLVVETNVLTLSASSSAPLDSACFGSTVNLFATGTGFAYYNWTGPSGFTSALQNPVLSNATTAQSGTYTVSASNTCGNRSASVTVQIDTTIESLNTSSLPNDTVCTGSNVTLNGSGTGVHGWSWSGPAGFTSTDQNPVLSGVTTGSSGFYVLHASNTCGSAYDSVSLVVENNAPNLTASSSATRDSACFGSTVNLFATGSTFD